MSDPQDTSPSPGPPPEGGPAPANEAGETLPEQLNRNWNELLQELRVVQTGVQILTGFLLTIPFQQRFTELTSDQHRLYLGLLVLSVLTVGMLIAPVAIHRILFRQGQKDTLVGMGNVLARIGLVCLCFVISGVVLLVFDVVIDLTTALTVSILILAFLLCVWFLVPLGIRALSRHRASASPGPQGGSDSGDPR